MIIISPISPQALEEAKVLAVKALDLPIGYSTTVILRDVRDAGDMAQVWGVLNPPHQYRFLEALDAIDPKTPSEARPYIEIVTWIRRYAYGILAAAMPRWDNSED